MRYDDPVWTIDGRSPVSSRGTQTSVDHVVWLSLRTSHDVNYSDPQEQSSIHTFHQYNEQLFAAAAASDGFLQVADWATYSNGASGWFESDGVHLTPRGVDALTTFIASTVDRVLAGQNVSPVPAPWTVLVPGAEGQTVDTVQDALIAAGVDVPGGVDGLYGDDTMVAVAAYQRRHEGFQVAGAVSIATARSLGVFDDPDAVHESQLRQRRHRRRPPSPPSSRVAAGRQDTVDVRVRFVARCRAGHRHRCRRSSCWSPPRRPPTYVVAQHATRRWACVHPSRPPAAALPHATCRGASGRWYTAFLPPPPPPPPPPFPKAKAAERG